MAPTEMLNRKIRKLRDGVFPVTPALETMKDEDEFHHFQYQRHTSEVARARMDIVMDTAERKRDLSNCFSFESHFWILGPRICASSGR